MTEIISPIENCPIHISGFLGEDFNGKIQYVPPSNGDPDHTLYNNSKSYRLSVNEYWKEYGYETTMA